MAMSSEMKIRDADLAAELAMDGGDGMPTESVFVDESQAVDRGCLSDDFEDFEELMSLALDDRLTPEEADRFEVLLAQAAERDPASEPAPIHESAPMQMWALWQDLDAQLSRAPAVAPAPDFSARVMQQLAWQERRKRLWLGSAIGVAALFLWGTALLVMLGLAYLLGANQALLLGELGQTLLHWWDVTVGLTGSALRSLAAILATAQARAVIMLYCVLATGMLSIWWVWLRRTTRVDGEPASV